MTLDNHAIIVLGMHRSGTSALTRVLNLLGVELGSAMMPVNFDNEGGFWEHVEIVDLHDRLLHAFSSSWDDVCRLPEHWWLDPRVEEFREAIRAILRRDFATSALWGIKDPRMCRLLPLWLPLFEELQSVPSFIFVSRNPIEIANSLERRNAFAQSKTLLLWLEHVLLAERDTQGRNRIFVSYDALLEDWRPVVAAAGKLGLAWPRPVEVTAGEIDLFLDRGRRHHRVPDVRSAASSWIAMVHEALEAAAAGEEAPLSTAIAPVAAALDEAQRLFAPQIQARGLDLQKQLDEMHATFTWQLSQAHKQVNRHQTSAEKTEEKLRKTEQRLWQTKNDLQETKASLSWKVSKPVRAVERMFRAAPRPEPAGEKKTPPDRKPSSPASKPAPKPATTAADGKEMLTAANLAALQNFLASGARLVFPTPARPEMSILLVLFNRAELTFACLRSLLAVRDVATELVIVDNQSHDHTGALLDRVAGATIIRNGANVHFLEGTNQAAGAAKGEFLLLLNNDTQLLPGSLEAALRTIKSRADIGAVGAKLILPDGTLQEAGSIVWNDGSCAGYGRGRDPLEPEFQFQRDVDFCSGAFLLTRRSLFGSGFHADFKPAYYEEVDYCLRLWEQGLRVVYDPNVVVQHYEFASSKTSDAAIELQKRNRAVFVAKHATALRAQFAPGAANVLAARMRDGQRPRILFFEDRIPHAHLGAGLPRAREMLTGLVELGFHVTFYPKAARDEDWAGIYESVPRTVEVILGPGKTGLEAFLAARPGYYDFILISRPHNMEFFQKLLQAQPQLFEKAKIIYDAEALFAVRVIQEKKLRGETVSDAERERLIRDEIGLTARADAVIAVTDAERDLFQQHLRAPCHTLCHSLDVEPTPAPFSARRGVLFVGAMPAEDSPNADAVRWLEKNVVPLLGDIPVTVIGRNAAPSVAELNRPGFRVLGAVRDITEFYNQARVFVAPSRFAAGIPLKVLEAAAHGLPQVVTPLLASQTGWKAGTELLVAEEPGDFASKIRELHEDHARWETVRRHALERIARDYSRAEFLRRLAQVFGVEQPAPTGAAETGKQP